MKADANVCCVQCGCNRGYQVTPSFAERSAFIRPISLDISLGGVATPMFSFLGRFAFFYSTIRCNQLGAFPGSRCSGIMDLL